MASLTIICPKGRRDEANDWIKSKIDKAGGDKTLAIELSKSGQPTVTHYGCNFAVMSTDILKNFKSDLQVSGNQGIKDGLEGKYEGMKAYINTPWKEALRLESLKIIETEE